MTHVMGIARDEAVQVLIEQALCRLFLATKATAGNKVRRSLQLAAHIDQALRHAYILLNRTIALRMSDDHLVATALQIVNRVLVLSKRIRIGMCRKLEQKLVGSIEMQVLRGIDTKFNELSMVDLEAHLERKTVSVITQQLKGIPHLVVIKIGITAVRSANDSGYTGPLGSLEHRQALIEIGGAVVYTRQDMAMNVTHRAALIN